MTTSMDLFRAIEQNDSDSGATIRRLISEGDGTLGQHEALGSPLMFAAALGHSDLALLLVELGAELDEQHHATKVGAVHVAAASGSLECLRVLLDAGAQTELRDGQGWTPLMFAVQGACAENVALLLSAGADVDAIDTIERTALMHAANSGHRHIAEQLIDAGADVNATGFCGTVFTPLVVAATSGRNEVVRLLVERGACIDFLDHKEGYTALMIAALMAHADTVELLIELGADVHIETEYFVSALTMAKRGGNFRIEEILNSAGAHTYREAPLPMMFPWGPIGDPLQVMALKQRMGSDSNLGGSAGSA